MQTDMTNPLEQKYNELVNDYNKLQTEYAELHKKLQEAEQQTGARAGGPEVNAEVPNPDNLESTLRRLIRQIAAILQAEKVAFMLFKSEESELVATPPAFGFTDDEINLLKVRATQGISGEVFRDGKPMMFHDAVTDPRTMKENVALFHIRNGLTVPLILEKRDEENRVVDRKTIGVLHAFNKQRGGAFIDEDIRLLERMSRNVAAVIANMQMYQAILEEKQELLHTIESLAAGLLMVSHNGRVAQMNQSARRIFGIDAEVQNRPFGEVITDASIQEIVRKAIDEGAEGELLEVTVRMENQEHIYQAQNAIVRGDDGKMVGTVVIFNDITDIRNLERMKSAFVATVSHELRTPLTAIKGFTSTLLQDSDDSFTNDDRREFYNIIDQETDRLTRLINDLLNIARIEAGESLKPDFKQVDFKKLASKVITIQRASTNKHTLALDVPDEIPPIMADEDKLDQIITNLISNAVKYSPHGGEVKLFAKMEDEDHLVFGIKDQGIGIPPEHVNKVFEKFHRVDHSDTRKAYGTGLGLFLVKNLVEEIHGGEIWCESVYGEGSTFLVRLPKVAPLSLQQDGD